MMRAGKLHPSADHLDAPATFFGVQLEALMAGLVVDKEPEPALINDPLLRHDYGQPPLILYAMPAPAAGRWPLAAGRTISPDSPAVDVGTFGEKRGRRSASRVSMRMSCLRDAWAVPQR